LMPSVGPRRDLRAKFAQRMVFTWPGFRVRVRAFRGQLFSDANN
jgi:hypothetical protein